MSTMPPPREQPDAAPGTTRAGIVGVGRMGANIARRLRDVGYTMAAVSDADGGRARELAAEIGAGVPETLAGVTAACDVVLTVVTDDAAMRAIFARDGDSLLRGARGKVFVNCATITPDVHVEVDALVRGAGGAAVEACMASSIPQARDGKLYLICGGDENAFASVKPLLEAMSVSLRWVGGPGRAAQVKALVNMLMNVNTAGLAEALGLGAALGLDLAALQDVFAHTGANSRVLETDGADMVAREHDVYFSAAHAAKDSGIALALGDRAGLHLPLAAATKAQYDRLVAAGYGELDKSAIAELTFPGRSASLS
ncbi:MAG TPA: NAD(P)-dependent oxidoreductase [Candidatus Elarobacter sp.]|jgi:3-hydroxyisobutyrate dehydrogenase